MLILEKRGEIIRSNVLPRLWVGKSQCWKKLKVDKISRNWETKESLVLLIGILKSPMIKEGVDREKRDSERL